MRVLTDLEPKNVFSFFEDICSIPHPSYKEEKISNYLVEFAKACFSSNVKLFISPNL